MALRALADLAEPLAGLVQVCEVRSVAADLAWLSPMYGTPCVAIHSLYPRRADSLDLARTYDPGRKFTNDFVRRWVG